MKLGDLAVVDAASEQHNPNPIDWNVCINGHDLNALVVQRFFNRVTKNPVKDMTNKANPHGGFVKEAKNCQTVWHH
jgi:hypothetical protein